MVGGWKKSRIVFSSRKNVGKVVAKVDRRSPLQKSMNVLHFGASPLHKSRNALHIGASPLQKSRNVLHFGAPPLTSGHSGDVRRAAQGAGEGCLPGVGLEDFIP